MTDFLVFFLPLPTVFRLQIPRHQQLILFFLFGSGFIVCVAETVRIVYAYKTTSTYDCTWGSYGLWIASVLELYIGIIWASIPACKPFFSRYIPSLLSSSFGSTKPSKNSNQKPSSSANSHSRKESLPSEPSNDDPVFDATVKGPPSYELQTVPLSKFSTRVNSNQLLPLSYLDNNDETVEHEVSRKESNEASAASGSGPSAC